MVLKEEHAEFLQYVVSRFTHVPASTLNHMIAVAQVEALSKGDLLLRRGEVARKVHLLRVR